ncbi:MAG: heavy-metal-associated domain-containing protein [Polymorphobacter sp.]
MKALLRLLLVFACAASAPLRAQNSEGSSSSAYAVAGIDVDVSAPNPEAARTAAFRIAQRKAWPLLWSRLTGGPASAAPRLSDGQLDSIVSGIESQGERFSMTRYIARLGVIFDRSRTGAFFAGSGAMLQSPPMLLLPLLSDGGVRTLYQAKTAWRAAWQRYRENVTPLDYVLAAGSASDNMLLTNWQVTRPDRASWRNILNRFDTVDVLTAEARLTRAWPGGPVTGLFIARHGPDATELARVTLQAADDDGVDAMLDAGVRQIDEFYAIALRDGRLRSEPDLTADLAPLIGMGPMIGMPVGDDAGVDAEVSSLEAAMATPDAATASALESGLRGTPGVTGVTITSLSLGGTTRLILTYTGARDALLFALDSRGLRLVAENGELVLRRRRDGEAAVPRPAALLPVPATAPAAPAFPPAAPPATTAAVDAARRPRSDARASAPAATAPPPRPAPAPPRPAQKPETDGPVDLLPRAGA